jgi:type II secretory pathway pseudopilin PulG
MSKRQRGRDDGETLIEILISIAILGIVVVGLGAAIAFAVRASGIHRGQAQASQYLHNYAETLQSEYKPCAANPSAAYVADLAALGTPTGFSAPTVDVAAWNGTSFNAGCSGPDLGLQRVTLTLTSTAGQGDESLVVVIRDTT